MKLRGDLEWMRTNLNTPVTPVRPGVAKLSPAETCREKKQKQVLCKCLYMMSTSPHQHLSYGSITAMQTMVEITTEKSAPSIDVVLITLKCGLTS